MQSKNIINSDDSDSKSESDEDSGFDDAFDCKSEVNCNKSKSNTSKPKDISGLTESLSRVHVSIPKNKTSPKTIETKKTSSEKKKSDWSNSQAKEKITAELCDSSSSIHKMSLREIHSKWAGQYKYHNFMTNYKRLQKKIEEELSKPMNDSKNQNHTSLSPSTYNKKPPIKQDEPKKTSNGPVIPKKQPQWNTKYCLASSVLHELYMMPDSEIHHMDVNEIHQSSLLFSCYPLDKFTQYNKKMKERTANQRDKVKRENELFQQDKNLFPCPEKTLHGQPFWHIHPAKKLLEKDVKNKVHERMTPKYLRMTRSEYQEFDLRTFGKHVYAEAAKQLNKAYWQLRRNKTAMKIHREQTKKNKLEWGQKKKAKEVIELVSEWKDCNKNDSKE